MASDGDDAESVAALEAQVEKVEEAEEAERRTSRDSHTQSALMRSLSADRFKDAEAAKADSNKGARLRTLLSGDWDKDGNGVISVDEIDESKIMASLDTDRDGSHGCLFDPRVGG